MTQSIGKMLDSVVTNVVCGRDLASAACSWNDLSHWQDAWLRLTNVVAAESLASAACSWNGDRIGKIPGSVVANVVVGEI